MISEYFISQAAVKMYEQNVWIDRKFLAVGMTSLSSFHIPVTLWSLLFPNPEPKRRAEYQSKPPHHLFKPQVAATDTSSQVTSTE